MWPANRADLGHAQWEGRKADVRPCGPHWGWWYAVKATKLQRPTQAKKAAVPAQDSAACRGSSCDSRRRAARSWRAAMPTWTADGLASLGDGVWKGHAV